MHFAVKVKQMIDELREIDAKLTLASRPIPEIASCDYCGDPAFVDCIDNPGGKLRKMRRDKEGCWICDKCYAAELEDLRAVNARLAAALDKAAHMLNQIPTKDSAIRFDAGKLVAECFALLDEYAPVSTTDTATSN